MAADEQPGLVEFLRARLDEDERHAHAALGLIGVENEWWSWDVLKSRFPALSRADARHIARFSPRRMLADVEAKRRIVEWVARLDGYASEPERWACPNPDEVLELLALPYASHESYREEWKP